MDTTATRITDTDTTPIITATIRTLMTGPIRRHPRRKITRTIKATRNRITHSNLILRRAIRRRVKDRLVLRPRLRSKHSLRRPFRVLGNIT